MKKIIWVLLLGSVGVVANNFMVWKTFPRDVKKIDGKLWQDMPVNKKKMLSWYEAKGYCENLEVMHDTFMLRDFRLPSVGELKHLQEAKMWSRFAHKQYGYYWTNKKFTKRKREYVNFIGFANDGHVGEHPAKLIQRFRCVHDYTLPVDESMTLQNIAQAITTEMSKEEKKKSQLKKPSKPVYVQVQTLQKDEFEKSSAFEKRVAKEEARVEALNADIKKRYATELNAWKEASAKAKAALEAQNSTVENKKRFSDALGKAMHFKYGEPLIASAVYDADAEVFDIVVFSSKSKMSKGLKSGNMLDKPVLSKKGLFSIERIENISADTTKVTLMFHKSLRRSMYLGHYKKVEHYAAYDKKTYSRTDHDDRWSPDYQDVISLYIPKLDETLYRAPFAYMLEQKVIKLNSIANPAYRVELKVPVKMEYAKKFKALLLSEEFKPSVEFEWDAGKLKAVGITQIKDPEMLVIENTYKKAQEDEAALEAFIEKYPQSSYANRAKDALESLQKHKRLKAEEREARNKAQETQRAQKEAKEREAYTAKKHVGDKVCMEGKMLLFMTVRVSGYVESTHSNKIQIRIADTEGQSPNYHGTTLRQDTIIWDDFDRWKGCE